MDSMVSLSLSLQLLGVHEVTLVTVRDCDAKLQVPGINRYGAMFRHVP